MPVTSMHTLSFPLSRHRMTSMREALRLHRLARAHQRLWFFYLEHNMFELAITSRSVMIQHLRDACQQWRLTLGRSGRLRP